ncbi:MAG: c-type cytochrome [Phycisphaerales bacterium]|jgi:cytochrome c oxidase cbb3-type subunit 3|nr:c-type cytochrome [Phycisphaerales bacterium]
MIRLAICVLLFLPLTSCGKPSIEDRPIRPSEVLDFNTLFSARCAGCHGTQGAGSGSIALHDAALLQMMSKDTMVDLITNGREGTHMPSFQSNTGNPLTDAQIHVIVDGIYDSWDKNAPPWSASKRYELQQGKITRGQGAFADMCGQCHGNDGLGASAGSVVDPAYLELVSAQYLRTVILCGRPELGMPAMGSKIDDRTADDIVAWLQTFRSAQ